MNSYIPKGLHCVRARKWACHRFARCIPKAAPLCSSSPLPQLAWPKVGCPGGQDQKTLSLAQPPSCRAALHRRGPKAGHAAACSCRSLAWQIQGCRAAPSQAPTLPLLTGASARAYRCPSLATRAAAARDRRSAWRMGSGTLCLEQPRTTCSAASRVTRCPAGCGQAGHPLLTIRWVERPLSSGVPGGRWLRVLCASAGSFATSHTLCNTHTHTHTCNASFPDQMAGREAQRSANDE